MYAYDFCLLASNQVELDRVFLFLKKKFCDDFVCIYSVTESEPNTFISLGNWATSSEPDLSLVKKAEHFLFAKLQYCIIFKTIWLGHKYRVGTGYILAAIVLSTRLCNELSRSFSSKFFNCWSWFILIVGCYAKFPEKHCIRIK